MVPLYTFLLCLCGDAPTAVRVCQTALERVRRSLPLLGATNHIDTHALTDLGGAFATLRPDPDYLDSLIQESVTPELVCLSWGQLDGNPRVATALRTEFGRSGIGGVAQMPGRYSAVIAERRRGRVWLGRSLAGSIDLHYLDLAPLQGGQRRLLVSPHDLCLVATGWSTGQLDETEGLAALTGSAGGRSLLQRTETCGPHEAVRWDSRGAARGPSTVLDHVAALTGQQALQERRAQVGELLVKRTERWLTGTTTNRSAAQPSELAVQVDASQDSRAVWALSTQARSVEHRLLACTDRDTRLALGVVSRLVRMTHASHRRAPLLASLQDSLEFERNLRLVSFFGNGVVGGEHAVDRCTLDPEASPRLHAAGASLFRGPLSALIPKPQRGGAKPSARDLAACLMKPELARVELGLDLSESQRDSLIARLAGLITDLSDHTKGPHECLDLLHLVGFERDPASLALPWLPRWSPFESTAALLLAWGAPAPLGHSLDLHDWLIQRYLPRGAAHLPYLPPITEAETGNRTSELQSRVRQALTQWLEPLRRTPPRPYLPARLVALREVVTRGLSPGVQALLTGSDALDLARQVAGAAGMQRLARAPAALPADLLSRVLAVQQWARLCAELR